MEFADLNKSTQQMYFKYKCKEDTFYGRALALCQDSSGAYHLFASRFIVNSQKTLWSFLKQKANQRWNVHARCIFSILLKSELMFKVEREELTVICPSQITGNVEYLNLSDEGIFIVPMN